VRFESRWFPCSLRILRESKVVRTTTIGEASLRSWAGTSVMEDPRRGWFLPNKGALIRYGQGVAPCLNPRLILVNLAGGHGQIEITTS